MTRFIVTSGFTPSSDKEKQAIESILLDAIHHAGIKTTDKHTPGTPYEVESRTITLASTLRDEIITQIGSSEVRKKHSMVAGLPKIIENLKDHLTVNQAQIP